MNMNIDIKQAYRDVVYGWGWKSFSILYEDQGGLVRLQDLMKASKRSGYRVMIRQLPKNGDYRAAFN